MKWTGRNDGLALAALLALVLAFARYQNVSRAVPADAPAPAVAPPPPAAPLVRTKAKARRTLVAALPAKPAAPTAARGSRLREKGEALGGSTPDRVDKTTDTRRTP